jgi:Holliday junction resolvase
MPLKNQTKYERDYVQWQIKQGNYAVRVAGSGTGDSSVCDCVLLKNGFTALVEVKATKKGVFYFDKRTSFQLERMIGIAMKHGAIPMLAVWFKNRGWRELILGGGIPSKFVWDGVKQEDTKQACEKHDFENIVAPGTGDEIKRCRKCGYYEIERFNWRAHGRGRTGLSKKLSAEKSRGAVE